MDAYDAAMSELPGVVPVVLTRREFRRAAKVGYDRAVASAEQGRSNSSGAPFHNWQNHMTGALGEALAAKALGVAWHPNVGGSDALDGDLPWEHGVRQVRATTRDRGGLRFYPSDDPAHAFLLVVTDGRRRGWLVGWRWGWYLREHGSWRPGLGSAPSGWELPQEALKPCRGALARVS